MPHSLRVPGADRNTIHLLEWSSEGTALLFIHGFSNDAHVWDDVAPVVAPHYRVLAIDLRGHGDSAWDEDGRYDSETLARDVEAVLDGLDIERVVVVGHSLGGRVSMQLAARAPQRLAGLVLVDSAPEHDPRGTTRIRIDTEKTATHFDSVQEYERVLNRQYPVTPPANLGRMAKHWLRERDDGGFELKQDPKFRIPLTGAAAKEFEARADEESKLLWAALKGLPCPCLVIRGAASDIMSPEVADRMVDEVIPNAKLEVIAQAGHSVMLDNPPDFERALCGFVLG